MDRRASSSRWGWGAVEKAVEKRESAKEGNVRTWPPGVDRRDAEASLHKWPPLVDRRDADAIVEKWPPRVDRRKWPLRLDRRVWPPRVGRRADSSRWGWGAVEKKREKEE